MIGEDAMKEPLVLESSLARPVDVLQENEVETVELDLPAVKAELLIKARECSERGLTQTQKWLSEMLHALKNVIAVKKPSSSRSNMEIEDDDEETYLMAKSYFDLKEYDRCHYFTADCHSPRATFLHFYSSYLSGEKKKLDNMQDTVSSVDLQQMTTLKELRCELQSHHEEKKLDGYGNFLYGIVLKKMSLMDQAKAVLLEAIHMEPCLWGAWLELAHHISDRATLESLKLPDHWIKNLFLAHTYVELQLNDQALEIYFGLRSGGLQGSTYILAQIAIAFHNMRQVDAAVGYFQQLSEIDPYRLDNLDIYSNLLYVKEQRVELAHLAHKSVDIDKYRTETCCVIGNYYSLRRQHGKAVLYFQRALKLNPNYLSAWTLMGHEFMELKNTHAAIQSYRKAIGNKRTHINIYGNWERVSTKKYHHVLFFRGQQKRLSSMVRTGPDLRSPQAAFLLPLLLQKSSRTPAERLQDAGGSGRMLRKAGQADGCHQVLLESPLCRGH